MYLTQKAQKVIKWIAYGIEILMIVLVISFGCALSSKSKALKAEQIKVKALTEQVDSLNRLNHALGSEVCYTVNCTIHLNSKNIMGVNTINSNNIAKTVATVTREELLNLQDSIASPRRSSATSLNKPTK